MSNEADEQAAELAKLSAEGRHKDLRKKAEAFAAAHSARHEGYWYRALSALLLRDHDPTVLKAVEKDILAATRLHPELDASVTVPNALTSSDSGSALAYLELLRAQRAASGGRYKQALKHTAKAVALAPEWAEMRCWHGRFAREAGEYATSEAAFSWLIDREPEEVGYYYERILARQNLGDRAGEAADWRRRIELQPGRAPHHIGLGKALGKVGDTAAAVVELERALAIDPESSEARAALETLR